MCDRGGAAISDRPRRSETSEILVLVAPTFRSSYADLKVSAKTPRQKTGIFSREVTLSNKKKGRVPGSLNRRDLLKAVMVAPTAALVQLARSVAADPPSVAAAEAKYAPKVFNEHQWKTLQVLSDLILPAEG